MADILTAYARALGITVEEADGSRAPLLALAFSHDLEGRPGAWHGGAIAGLLETAGYAALRTALAAAGRTAARKPITVTEILSVFTSIAPAPDYLKLDNAVPSPCR